MPETFANRWFYILGHGEFALIQFHLRAGGELHPKHWNRKEFRMALRIALHHSRLEVLHDIDFAGRAAPQHLRMRPGSLAFGAPT
jgi:hypothetical protein